MRLLLVTVLIGLGLASPASARTVFGVYGTERGATAPDECPAGSFFVGLVGNVGSWIDQISVICGKQMPDGSISGNDNLPPRGGNGGNISSVLCGKDEVVSEMQIVRTKDYQIFFIMMTCVNVNTLTSNIKRFGGKGTFYGEPQTQSCKTGELGTGLVLWYGQFVYGAGLICNEFRRPVAAQPPPPPPPAPAQFASPSAPSQLCRDYAARQEARDAEYARLNCRGWAGPRMTAAEHERFCLNHRYGVDDAKISESTFQSVIDACKRDAATTGAVTTGAVTKTVVAEVTLYDRPTPPQTECYLQPNDTVTVLTGAEIPQAFRNLDDNKWVPVKGASGGCTGRIGGVYNDGELK